MAIAIDPGEIVFLDTSYALALSAPTDQFHAQAVQLADELEARQARLLTTRAVMLEIGNALSKQRYRTAAVALLDSLECDSRVEIAPLTEEIFGRAFGLFRARLDKEWGLIDCVSFILMSDRGIGKALTTDEHFQQSGFRALLREISG